MGLFGKAKLNRSKQTSYIPSAGVHPICPHCVQVVEGVYTQEIKMSYGKTWLFFCTKCAKVLGASQRKGFWMG